MSDLFTKLCKAKGLGEPTAEYRFAPPRRWRMDYAWPSHMVALEVEGGIFNRGRHTRGVGYKKDMEKYSEAAARGWLVIRVPPSDLLSQQTFEWIERAQRVRAA